MQLLYSTSQITPTRAAPAAGLRRLACVGDSITFGHGLRDESGDYSYPAVLARLLGTSWLVRNFGVSGTTLLHRGDHPYVRTEAYSAALAFRPDMVVIKLGTNDSKRPRPGAPDAPDNWRHKADYAGDYRALIATFRAVNPSARVFVCLPVPAYPGNWGIDDITLREEISPLVRAVAIETGSTPVDLYSALSGHPECFPDTVHPDANGAALIAAAVHRQIMRTASLPSQ